MLMCVCAFVCAHAAMLMTVVHTYHMSAPLRLCIYMYEWGRANGKQHQLRPFCVCLKEKKLRPILLSCVYSEPPGGRDSNENSCWRLLTYCWTCRCAVEPLRHLGQNRAQQVRLRVLVCIPEIEINTHVISPEKKNQYGCEESRGGKVVEIYKASYQHNELCFDSALAELFCPRWLSWTNVPVRFSPLL